MKGISMKLHPQLHDFINESITSLNIDKQTSIMVHADIISFANHSMINGEQLSKIAFNNKINVDALLEESSNGLMDNFQNVFMGTFNYRFPKTKRFNINKDKSQIGALNEYFRVHKSTWRNHVPVFSFCGNNIQPALHAHESVVNPFGRESVFQHLYDINGYLLFYGATLGSLTYLHYVEEISNNLIYRYHKKFHGVIIDEQGKEHEISTVFHVRPMGLGLNYDWDKITHMIQENNLVINSQYNNLFAVNIRNLVDFLVSQIQQQPFIFLTDKSKHDVEKKYHQLKRPFQIQDFE